ncbi:MAG: CvpA family protein [Candidatus Limnocylindrus sp.]
MSATVLVDLVVVVVLVLAAWTGGRTGAARSAVSLIALALGLVISAQGQSAITSSIAQIFPDIDTRLIGIGIFIGGIWILLAVASYLIGRLLQASLRAIHLGPVDTALGALFGVLQWSVAIAALVFVVDAAASVNFPLPSPLSDIATAIASAQSSDIIRGFIYPIANQLFGGSFPEGLRALLVP